MRPTLPSPLLPIHPLRAAAPCAVALATLCACGRATTLAASSTPEASAPSAPDAGFVSPPALVGASRTGDGGVRIAGRAPAGAQVRLASPEGDQREATASDLGAWSVAFGGAAAPRLYALSAQAGRRSLRGEGALAVLPSTSETAAVLLRSGAPAWPVQVAPSQPPRLASLDFDAGGGFAASGSARPGSAVRLTLDGAVAGQGQADAGGRFAVLGVAAPVVAAPHTVAVQSAEGADARSVAFAPAAPLTAPYRAARVAGGWRIDWATPGGGVQSVLAFDRSAAAAPPSSPEPGA